MFGSRFSFWWGRLRIAAPFRPPQPPEIPANALTWLGEALTWQGEVVTWRA